jgi:hypothetical protein
MDSREQYEYHKLLKFLYFEGYANSYEDAAYLLEELSDEELDELLEEYELNEAHTFPLSPEERAIVSRIAAINRGETPKKKTSTKSASKIEPSTSGPRRMGVQGVEYKEEYDLYDIILDHLLDEGYAETVESAEAIMVNMSEEWKDEILDEAQQIMSVSGKGGLKHMINPTVLKLQNATSRERQQRQAREKAAKEAANTKRSEQARKTSIATLNAKPGADSGDYDAGYHGDDDASNGDRHYSLSRTNRSARKRRETGR